MLHGMSRNGRIDEIARDRVRALNAQDETEKTLDKEVTGITNWDEDYLIALSRSDFAAAFVIADLAFRKLGQVNTRASIAWATRARDMRIALGAQHDES